MADKPRLDEVALTELKDVMEDEFDVLIDAYLADSADRIRALRRAIDAADADDFAKTAHSLKGSSINIGAPHLGELCLRAEEAGKHQGLGQAGGVVDAIESEFFQVAEILRRLLP